MTHAEPTTPRVETCDPIKLGEFLGLKQPELMPTLLGIGPLKPLLQERLDKTLENDKEEDQIDDPVQSFLTDATLEDLSKIARITVVLANFPNLLTTVDGSVLKRVLDFACCDGVAEVLRSGSAPTLRRPPSLDDLTEDKLQTQVNDVLGLLIPFAAPSQRPRLLLMLPVEAQTPSDADQTENAEWYDLIKFALGLLQTDTPIKTTNDLRGDDAAD